MSCTSSAQCCKQHLNGTLAEHHGFMMLHGTSSISNHVWLVEHRRAQPLNFASPRVDAVSATVDVPCGLKGGHRSMGFKLQIVRCVAAEEALEGLRLWHTSAPTAINATAMICSLGQKRNNPHTRAECCLPGSTTRLSSSRSFRPGPAEATMHLCADVLPYLWAVPVLCEQRGHRLGGTN